MGDRRLPLISLLASFTPLISWAQGAPSPTSSTSDSNAPELQEVVVTAQRRSESSQRAAVALSTVSGETLRDAAVSEPADLGALVPSLQVTSAAGPYALFYLRGVGNFSGNALADSAVAFNSDGVYIGRPSSTTGFFYDVNRIEVLKGPQGTLYGRNATGGAINVISNKPDLNEFGGDFGADFGNYAAVRLDGAVNVPVSDIAAMRFAGIYVKHSGYMADGTDDQNDLGGRVSFLVQPISDLSITTVADLFRQRGDGVGGIPVVLGLDGRQGALSTAGNAFYSIQPNTILGRPFYPLGITPNLDNNYWGISSTVDWRTTFGTFTLVPAYRRSKLEYQSDTPGFYINQYEQDRQSSMEARFATNDDNALRFLIGAFFYDENNDIPRYAVNQESNINFQQFDAKTTSKAAFTRLTYAIVPDVRVTAGARYTRDDKDLEGKLFSATRVCVLPTSFFPTYVPGCPAATAFPNGFAVPLPNFDPTIDGTVTTNSLIDQTGQNARHSIFSRATYRGGIDWDVTPSNLLYASYETGFKAGGFFFSADGGVFQPEKISAYTLGSKNRFLGNHLQLNLEGFYWLYRDQQISHVSFDSIGDVVFATENVGKASFKGIEVESEVLATANTLLTSDVQYLNAKYDSFVHTTPNLNGGIDNGTSCSTVGVPGIAYTVDCSGKQPPNAPTWTINVSAQQTVPLSNGGKLVGSVSGHFQTTTLTGLEFLPDEYQHQYWLADARLTYAHSNDRFRVSAYVNNMFDKTVISGTFPTPFSLFRTSSLRPPRTFGIRIQTHF